MKQFSAEVKHSILLEYQLHTRTHSFAALARRHSITGGDRTIQRWYSQWNGTVASLTHKKGGGRPHILTEREVQHHIAEPIRRLNRAHRAVRYTSVARELRTKTGKHISDRTVQWIGKKELGARKTKGLKRTAEECK